MSLFQRIFGLEDLFFTLKNQSQFRGHLEIAVSNDICHAQCQFVGAEHLVTKFIINSHTSCQSDCGIQSQSGNYGMIQVGRTYRGLQKLCTMRFFRSYKVFTKRTKFLQIVQSFCKRQNSVSFSVQSFLKTPVPYKVF